MMRSIRSKLVMVPWPILKNPMITTSWQKKKSSSEIRIELREDICCRDTQTTCVATDLSQRNGKLMDLDVRFFGKSWQVLPWHCLHAELCTKPYLGMLQQPCGPQGPRHPQQWAPKTPSSGTLQVTSKAWTPTVYSHLQNNQCSIPPFPFQKQSKMVPSPTSGIFHGQNHGQSTIGSKAFLIIFRDQTQISLLGIDGMGYSYMIYVSKSKPIKSHSLPIDLPMFSRYPLICPLNCHFIPIIFPFYQWSFGHFMYRFIGGTYHLHI